MSYPPPIYPTAPQPKQQRQPSLQPQQPAYSAPYVPQYSTSPARSDTSASQYGVVLGQYGSTPPGQGFYGSTPPQAAHAMSYHGAPQAYPPQSQMPPLRQYPSAPQMPPLQQHLSQQEMPPLQHHSFHQTHLTPYNGSYAPASLPEEDEPSIRRHSRTGSYSSHHSHRSHRSRRSSNGKRDKSDRATLGDTMWEIWDALKSLMPVGKR